MVAHTFNPRTQEADLYEFEVSLVYRVPDKTGSKATQRNAVLKTQEKKNKVLDFKAFLNSGFLD